MTMQCRLIPGISILALLACSALMMWLGSMRFESDVLLGMALAVAFAFTNLGISFYSIFRAVSHSVERMGQVILALFLVRMLLFAAGVGIGSKMDGIDIGGFGITFILLFFVVTALEVWYVMEWNQVLKRTQTGEDRDVSPVGIQ